MKNQHHFLFSYRYQKTTTTSIAAAHRIVSHRIASPRSSIMKRLIKQDNVADCCCCIVNDRQYYRNCLSKNKQTNKPTQTNMISLFVLLSIEFLYTANHNSHTY